MSALPGVNVGPLDPDRAERFGHVSQGVTARQLIRVHSQLHPVELTRVLARPLDPERTKALDLDEVRGYLGGLKRDNDDPVVPEGTRVVAAQVHGERDTEQVLTFVYRTESGRTAKWWAPYDRDQLSESARAGDELVKVAGMRERGIVAWDSEGTQREIDRRELSRLRRENDALRSYREGRGEEPEASDAGEDVRPDTAIVDELETVRREREELLAEVQQLRSAVEQMSQEQQRREAAGEAARKGAQEPPSGDPEPVEGYDTFKADRAVALLRSDETSGEDRQRILDYERAHANRRSVVSAAEESLTSRG